MEGLKVLEFDQYFHEIPDHENPAFHPNGECIMIVKAYEYYNAAYVVLEISHAKPGFEFDSVLRLGTFDSIEAAREFAHRKALLSALSLN